MEFQYRAVDERRSRSPPPPPAPSTPGSGSADGDGPPERVGHSAVTLWQPALAPPETTAAAAEAHEVRRQAEKARIRERILREEAEQWELELEVRREIREQMLRLSWPPLSRAALGSDTAAAPSPGTVIAANSALPAVVKAHHEAHLKVAAMSAKRKSHDLAAAASTVSLAATSKKQKVTLTCNVCGITANSEKAMQGHLNGKLHKKTAVARPELPKLGPETEQGGELDAEEEEAMAMEILGDYKPTKFMMATDAGVLSEVTQMDGYILCELCNVRTADRVTMMCHLQGSKHISKIQKKNQPSTKPSGDVVSGTISAAKECVQGISNSAIASADPEKLLLEDDASVPLPSTVRRSEGFLLCELCDVKATSRNGMREHLSGKKHKNKARTIANASVNVSTGGKEAAKAQPVNTNTDLAATVEAPLELSLQPKLGDDSELQEMTVAPTKEDVTTGDSTKTPGTEMMKTSTNTKTPGTEMMKTSTNSAGAQLNNVVCGSASLTMEVDGVMHPLCRVDGFLVCLSCNAKAPSEIIMQSHLAGKKHKRKMTVAARGNKDLSVIPPGTDKVKANAKVESAPSAVPQAKTAIAMEPMEVDTHSEPGDFARVQSNSPKSVESDEPAGHCEITAAAEGDQHAPADSNGAVTQAKESTDVETTVPSKPFKIQVEGKVFTVMQQENGRLSCDLCCVHGCDKDSMIQHLYTSTHWGKASLSEKEEKERAGTAAVAVVDEDGEFGSMAGGGSGGLTSENDVGAIISDCK